jgi:hypothetical protein
VSALACFLPIACELCLFNIKKHIGFKNRRAPSPLVSHQLKMSNLRLLERMHLGIALNGV